MIAEIISLHWRLAWARVLLWVATATSASEPTPEMHWYLADLHYKMAYAYTARHWRKAARQHRRIAEEHALAGPPPPPRPAAAMAMPVPQSPIFTDARGKYFEPDPDDVA
jgi:hypothetical protein